MSTQSQIWNELIGVFGKSLPAVTGLAGVLIGAYITNRNQRQHWVADNKKREYQELITALICAFSAILEEVRPMVGHGPEEQRAFAAAQEKALITISDRIFTQRDVERLKILDRWQSLIRNVKTTRDTVAFSAGVGEIKFNLVDEACRLMD
jgi:hypothetical protein